MRKKQPTIESLISDIDEYQKSILRSDSTIMHYHQKWMKVKLFMERSELTVYDKAVETSFLHSVLGNYDYNKLSVKDKTLVNVVKQLLFFQETGAIEFGPRKKRPEEKYPFTGELGAFIKGYIEKTISEKRLTKSTSISYYLYLDRFNAYLESKKINHIKELNTSVINGYIAQLYPDCLAARYNAVKIIKHFLHDMYLQGETCQDFSLIIENVNYRNQPHLPTTLSVAEVERLLSSIDRSNPKGKRDYAILLLAARLGLRCSDIVRLQFSDIDWEKSLVTLFQQKTGKMIELTLLPDVGNAIIDYLKYGRPVSADKHIFLQLLSPYKNMVTHDIGNLLKPYMVRAGINCKNRKHGPHILRHSLASQLLASGTPLPIISETLGHASSETTLFYLRIDSANLRKCALDVPPVPSSFYEKEGGVYEQ